MTGIIINSPYREPSQHWFVEDNQPDQWDLREGRRPARYFPPRRDGAEREMELELVNRIRPLVKDWRKDALSGGGGVSATTMDLLQHWHREGRQHRLFFAQLEAAETIIFLTEARTDYLQGIDVPLDKLGEVATRAGHTAFRRLCCKLATGGGKTVVMGMLAAWSILNKINSRTDKRFSDAVLVVCPNITIRERLRELNTQRGDASIYRTRDLVPSSLMSKLSQGRVFVVNWHVFEPQSGQTVSGRVLKSGKRVTSTEVVHIGARNDTVRGKRYMTEDSLRRNAMIGMLTIVEEKRDRVGKLKKVWVETERYLESDTALVRRVLWRDLGDKKNMLVMNDEAHHAYRVREDEESVLGDEEFGDKEFAAAYRRGATVWVNGLDKIHKQRGINRCLDFSATPYFLSASGADAGNVFPWVVSDFGFSDAIEAGLVKVPRFSVRTPDGENSYYDLWTWILDKLQHDGGRRQIQPEAVLRYAHAPLQMMAEDWERTRLEWEEEGLDDRPPVLIIVCKNVDLAKAVYEWITEANGPGGMPSCGIESLRNTTERCSTVRIDSKVSKEIESGEAESSETQWMRFVLDTVGKNDWPRDKQGEPLYPPEFEALADKLGRPKTPPGRDIRCIVSVSMLTEGWDCNTVTHIVGLRPFMSQLLCEQVVGRGLRRVSYETDENDLPAKEVATVFGVPFRDVPVESVTSQNDTPAKRYHIHALPEKSDYAISYPRVDGYKHEVRERITADFSALGSLQINDREIPTRAIVRETPYPEEPSIYSPGQSGVIQLSRDRRLQKTQFKMASNLTKAYVEDRNYSASALDLFPQMLRIVRQYFAEKIAVSHPDNIMSACVNPHYERIYETLVEAITPDTEAGEQPELPRYEQYRQEGSTEEVDFYTRREPMEVRKSHLNAIVTDSKLEQRAAYVLDTNELVQAFVKNDQLSFAIPYLREGGVHEYRPDFIIRLQNGTYLILETKGFDDPHEGRKSQAAIRWVKAVNSDEKYGHWNYEIVREEADIEGILRKCAVTDVPN